MRETYGVRYAPQALEDLKDLYVYVAHSLRAPGTAKSLTTRIRKAIRELERFPEKHPTVEWEPWKSRNLRKMPVGNFVVFYRVDEPAGEVMVIRIVYGGRDMERVLDPK